MHDPDRRIDPTIRLVPIDGAVAGRKSHRSILNYVLIAGAAVLSLAAVLAVILTIARIGKNVAKSVIVTDQRDLAELRQESVRVYRSFDAKDKSRDRASPEEIAERESIDAFFRRLEACAATQNNLEFIELVDFDRLLKRIELTGYLYDWTFFDKRSLRTQLRLSASPEPFWTNITVAGIVTPDDDPDTRVVYTICVDPSSQSQTEDRFWIARDGDSWKLYDWERLDLGLSESREWGLGARHAESSLMDSYQRWGNLLAEADALIEGGELDAAKAKLRLAEQQEWPTDFHDFCWLLTGYRWVALGELTEAERCYRNVVNPAETPGASFGLMTCLRWKDPSQALQHAGDYEVAVGPTADVLEISAQLLEYLGRNDEAVEQWRKLLRHQPENPTALTSLFLALPKENKSKFEQQIERLDDPVDTVAEIARSIGYEDYDGLLSLVEYVNKKAPDAAGTHYVAGLATYFDGQYDEAARQYWRAYEAQTDEDLRGKYLDSYLEAMTADGKVLIAWQNLPDPASAFSSLLDSHEEYDAILSEDEYRDLVRLYRERYPDDIEGIAREARLAIREDRYDDAVPQLRDALVRAKAEDEADEESYQVAMLTDSLVHALYKLGQLSDAYEVKGDWSERFTTLVEKALTDQHWDDVRWLVDTHRSHVPDDPSIHAVEGQLAAREQHWDSAIQHFRTGLSESEDQQWQFWSPLAEAYVDSGRWREFFESTEDPGELFDSLAERFVADKNWSALDELVRDYRQRSPADTRIAKREANAAWEREDYDRCIPLFQQLLAIEDEAEVTRYERRHYEYRLLRALLRTGQFEQARAHGQQMQNQRFESATMALVEAAAGNSDAARRLAFQTTANSKSASEFYHHEDVGRVFLGEAFTELHRDFPVEIRLGLSSVLAVFLFEEPLEWGSAEVVDELRAIAPEGVTVKPLRSIGDDCQWAFALEDGDSRIWIAGGEGPFYPPWRVNDDESSYAPLLKNSQSWLAVGTAAWLNADRRKEEELARRIASQLAGEHASALCARGRVEWDGLRIYPITTELLDAWRETGLPSPHHDKGMRIGGNERNTIATDRTFHRELRGAARDFEAIPGMRLEVVFCMSNHPKIDPLVLVVQAVRRKDGSLAFDGLLKNSSTLVPDLRAGLPMRIWLHEVRAWQLNDDKPVFRPEHDG